MAELYTLTLPELGALIERELYGDAQVFTDRERNRACFDATIHPHNNYIAGRRLDWLQALKARYESGHEIPQVIIDSDPDGFIRYAIDNLWIL